MLEALSSFLLGVVLGVAIVVALLIVTAAARRVLGKDGDRWMS